MGTSDIMDWQSRTQKQIHLDKYSDKHPTLTPSPSSVVSYLSFFVVIVVSAVELFWILLPWISLMFLPRLLFLFVFEICFLFVIWSIISLLVIFLFEITLWLFAIFRWIFMFWWSWKMSLFLSFVRLLMFSQIELDLVFFVTTLSFNFITVFTTFVEPFVFMVVFALVILIVVVFFSVLLIFLLLFAVVQRPRIFL